VNQNQKEGKFLTFFGGNSFVQRRKGNETIKYQLKHTNGVNTTSTLHCGQGPTQNGPKGLIMGVQKGGWADLQKEN